MKKLSVMIIILTLVLSPLAFAAKGEKGASEAALKNANDQAIFNRTSDWFASIGKSAEEKEAFLAERKAARAQKTVEKEASKAKKQAEKLANKADAEKEAKKAQKQAEKEAKKAEKEAKAAMDKAFGDAQKAGKDAKKGVGNLMNKMKLKK